MDWATLESAQRVGMSLDLSGCVYGPAHWAGETFSTQQAPHYAFLAGLVQVVGATRIAELGTHFGGATQAMLIGAADVDDVRMATVDVTHLNAERLARYPVLQRVHGDALAPEVVTEFVGAFDRHVDVLFIDTVHTYRQTLESIAVYANRLKPRILVLDDIRLNAQMRALWDTVKTAGAGDVFDVSELIGRSDAGFGVVVCQYPFAWPEAHPIELAALRRVWHVQRAVGTRLPPAVKDRIRQAMYRIVGARRS